MIGKLFEYFIGTLFLSISTYYTALRLSNKKITIFDFKVIIILFVETILFMLLYKIFPQSFIRIIMNYIIIFFVIKIIVHSSAIKNVIVTSIVFTILIISENGFGLLMQFFDFDELDTIKNSLFLNLYSNLGISFLNLLITELVIKFNLSNLKKEFGMSNSILNFKTMLLFICLVVNLSVLLYYLYFDISLMIGFIVNLFLIICYVIFIITILKERNVNYKLKIQYDVILKNMESYENDLMEQRMKNHENKNLLISIKGMINKNDVHIYEFLNQIITDEFSEDKNVLQITQNIPLGGLQGLIYQKLLVMEKHSICYHVNIDRKIKKNSFNKLSTKTIKNICMATGVFIDNAIQETINNRKKLVGIQMYNDRSNIVIEISNNFTSMSDLSLLDKKGFTTKKNGHGYGLSLVKEIVNKDRTLENERKIVSDIFIQKLIVKI